MTPYCVILPDTIFRLYLLLSYYWDEYVTLGIIAPQFLEWHPEVLSHIPVGSMFLHIYYIPLVTILQERILTPAFDSVFIAKSFLYQRSVKRRGWMII